MEEPIQVAVRIFPCCPNELCRVEIVPNNIERTVKQSNSFVSNGHQPSIDRESCGLVQVIRSQLGEDNNGNAVDNDKKTFKFRHALPFGCSQEYVYRTTVQPMIRNFLEGYDVSIVTYGQSCTGKTYCMYGPIFDGAYNDLEQGIVPRAIFDIFTQLAKRPNGCRFSVNVAWIDICGNEIRDNLGQGIVPRIIQCHNLTDVFQCLRIGFANRNPESNHSIFTITIEQKWVTPDGLIQHRLSTASFCDLAGTQRTAAINQFNETINVPKDIGLQMLERIVDVLSNSNALDNDRNSLLNLYDETTLTKLLMDSFGGRAQTLMICLVSPLEQDTFETMENLHVAYKAQFVRNAVVLNTFSDNNEPIANFIDPVMTKASQYNPTCNMNKLNVENVPNTVSMDFANAQWTKLISNAESLFNKLLLNNKSLNDDDRECIEEWMFMKQECESFGSFGLMNPRLLKPIQETDENSDNESNCEGGEQDKTDVSGQNVIFSDNDTDDEENFEQVEAKVSDLMTNFSHKVNEVIEENYQDYIETYPCAVLNSHGDKELECENTDKAIVKAVPTDVTINHRRRSIQTGDTNGLNPSNIARLQRISEECMKNNQQLNLQNTICREANAFLENSDEMHPLRMANRYKAEDDIVIAIRRVQNDIEAKKKEIAESKQNIKLIDELVESTGEQVKAKRDLDRRVSALQQDRKRCKKMITNSRDEDEIEKLQTDLKEIEQELKEKYQFKEISRDSETTLKGYQQNVSERQKQLSALKKSLKTDQKLLKDLEGKLKIERTKKAKEEKKSTACVNADTRITQLDYVLKEKNEYLRKNIEESETVESIRHEIRNLRDQRDRLTDAQCILNQKLKRDHLTDCEARQIIEYEVAKEVIDHAMEMKNQLICGRDISMKRNFMENPDLMGQLSKLNEKEMRILLYKCFQKIVDLRDSSCQLEKQVLSHEHEQHEWEFRERALYDKFKLSRWQAERYLLNMQKQYQSSLTQLMRKAGEECGPSNMSNDSLMLPSPLHLVHWKNRHHQTISNEIGFGIQDYRGASQQQHSYRFTNAALAATSKRDNAEPMELLQKQKPKMNILKLFSSSSGLKRNLQQQQQHLMLMNHAQQNARIEKKVTVVKNKIIILQNKS